MLTEYVPGETVGFRVERLNVLSMGIMFSALHAAIGLMMGGILSVSALTGGGAEPMFLGPWAVVLMPLINAVLGFAGGILMAGGYNLGARFLGGIKISWII